MVADVVFTNRLRVAALLTSALLVSMTGLAPVSAASSVTFLKTLAGSAAAAMYPSGVEWDANLRRIVVADTGNDHIEFYNPVTAARIGSFGRFGSANGQFNSPRDVAVDGQSDIFVADAGNDRVQEFDGTGKF